MGVGWLRFYQDWVDVTTLVWLGIWTTGFLIFAVAKVWEWRALAPSRKIQNEGWARIEAAYQEKLNNSKPLTHLEGEAS